MLWISRRDAERLLDLDQLRDPLAPAVAARLVLDAARRQKAGQEIEL